MVTITMRLSKNDIEPDRDESAARTGYLTLIRGNRNFRNLWFGQIVSLLGDWFNMIAAATLVATLTKSASAVGGLFVVRLLAPFLVSPLAGVIADRYNRKHLLIATDLTRAVVVLGFLFVRDPAHVWLLYALTALQLGIAGFFFPARNAILPSIVSRSELGDANALSSVTWSVMLAMGTALGGLVAGSLGIYWAFVIDAASFVASASFISFVQYHTGPHVNRVPGGVGAAFHQYVDGLKYLRHNLHILAIACIKGSYSLTATGALMVVQVALAERIYVIGKNGGIGLGLMFAVVGVGTGIGPIVARRFTGDRNRTIARAIAVGILLLIAGTAVMATLPIFPILMFGLLLRGIGPGMNWVFSTQLLMQLVPDDVRGRVFATEFAIFTVSGAISSGVAGLVMDLPGVGMSNLLWWATGLTLIPAILWMVYLRFNRSDALRS